MHIVLKKINNALDASPTLYGSEFCTGMPSLEATGIWHFIVGIRAQIFRGPKFQTSGADGSLL